MQATTGVQCFSDSVSVVWTLDVVCRCIESELISSCFVHNQSIIITWELRCPFQAQVSVMTSLQETLHNLRCPVQVQVSVITSFQDRIPTTLCQSPVQIDGTIQSPPTPTVAVTNHSQAIITLSLTNHRRASLRPDRFRRTGRIWGIPAR